MSVESVQFVEMVRQAAAEINEKRFALVFCRKCKKDTTHVMRLWGKRGRIYKCYECGLEFEVR